jgi:uncharacterized membrane protein
MTEMVAIATFCQTKILPPSDVGSNLQILLRWIHLIAGITWIGLLYFFNLVSPKALAGLDPPTRGKVIPALLPPALWWFRWSALVTVLTGFLYWVLILQTEPPANPGAYLGRTLGLWFLLVVVTFGVQFLLLRIAALTRNTWVFVLFVLFLVGGMGHFMVQLLTYEGASNRALAIAVGGGIGLFLLLNVWGIVWRAQKRLIAWTKESAERGTAMPPQAAMLSRRAYLVARAGFWLSFPMLFFMAAASHYPLFVGG